MFPIGYDKRIRHSSRISKRVNLFKCLAGERIEYGCYSCRCILTAIDLMFVVITEEKGKRIVSLRRWTNMDSTQDHLTICDPPRENSE